MSQAAALPRGQARIVGLWRPSPAGDHDGGREPRPSAAAGRRNAPAGSCPFEAIDEVLAPNYVNIGMRGIDLAGFKAMLPAIGAVISDMRFDIQDLVAEGEQSLPASPPR